MLICYRNCRAAYPVPLESFTTFFVPSNTRLAVSLEKAPGIQYSAITSIPSLVSRNFTWEKVGTLDIGIDFTDLCGCDADRRIELDLQVTYYMYSGNNHACMEEFSGCVAKN